MSSVADEEYCFLQVSIAGRPPHRIVIQLFRDKVPLTCQNFASLISAPGTTSPSRPLPTYRGSIFHRIVPGFMVQGGDFDHFDGTGGYAVLSTSASSSSHKTTFDDESFVVPHGKAGVVSMANKGKDTNGSQFFITLQQTPHLNQKHVAFGQVIEGMEIVQSMATDVELEGTKPTAMQKIVIIDCGMGKGNLKPSDGSSCSSSSNEHEVQTKREKKARKKHKKKKRSKESSKKSKKKRRRRDEDYSSASEDFSSSEDSYRDRKRRKRHKQKKKPHDSRKRKDHDDPSTSSSDSSDNHHSDGHRKKRR